MVAGPFIVYTSPVFSSRCAASYEMNPVYGFSDSDKTHLHNG
jgi:hypothetical protein